MSADLMPWFHVAFGIAFGLLIAEVRDRIHVYRLRREYRRAYPKRTAP